MSEIFRIVNGALRLDIERVRNYTAFLAEKLEKAGDTATAKRLRKLLQETDHQLRPGSLSAARALPVDSQPPQHDLTHAEQIGKKAVGTILPWLDWNCRSGHCGTFAVTHENGRFSAEARVQLPLNVLLGHLVSVSFQDTEVWEGNFAR